MSLYKSIPHTFRKEGIYYFNRRVPNPNKIIQESLFGNIIKEKNYVHGSRKLIKIYTQKIQDKISKVWGDGVEPMITNTEENSD